MAGKKIVNEKKIISSYVQSIRKAIDVDRALIFGSRARSAATQESDIDLLVISRDFEHRSFIDRLELLNRLRTGDALQIPMDIVGVTPQEFLSFKSHESPNLRAIYRDSKPL